MVLFGLIIRIPNSIQYFGGKRKLKLRYLSHTSHFVLKICETIRPGIWSTYWNTRILFKVPKNPNNEYRILFGIEKI